ncbi:amidase [Pseudonocardia spinosispora]|uniref:amidase n=1 Tax=Pseudonocardia spinosispora TaxID=103441 RepID=UPI000685C093|nr:amidase [Pseudonocardia spinosispora]
MATVAEWGGQLRAGTVSVESLVEDALAAADRAQALNAFVTVDADGARAAARTAAAELADGVDRGPLHGIPVVVKDMLDTRGLRTTMGSRHFADRVPTEDAELVRRLRDGGAVVLGKTTTHEFAYGPTGDRSANGPARNPHDPGRMSGGSSAGAAVAVAAGVVGLSIGTDTGGSVRVPAACCGVVGFKPTHGVLDTRGAFPLAPSLDTLGVLAGSVADCALFWRFMTGTAEASSTPAPRIGWVSPEQLHPTDPRVTDTALGMLARFDKAEVRLPFVEELRWSYRAIQSWEATGIHAQRMADAPELFDAEVLARLRDAATVTHDDYERAARHRDAAHRAFDLLWQQHDLLALPTVPITAPPIGVRQLPLGDTTIDVRAALLSLTSPFSVLGLPALSVPAGLVDGLPVGLQLVAPRGQEQKLLNFADQL